MSYELNVNEIRKCQLDMLSYVDELCRKNSINYSLAYGTLLGAIRHKGYIPWDDDIDLMMLRSDYERFIELFSISNNEKYHCLSYKSNWFNWLKICDSETTIIEKKQFDINDYGVWIDIFPIDEVPDPKSFCGKLHMRTIKILKKLSQVRAVSLKNVSSYRPIKGVIWLIPHIILRVFPIKFYSYAVEKLITMYQGKKTGYLAETNFYWKDDRRSFNEKMFDNYVDVPFEGVLAKCISGYDYYLKVNYDDYMRLPDENMRITDHSYKAYKKSSC